MKKFIKLISLLIINVVTIISLTGFANAKTNIDSADLYVAGEVPIYFRYAEIERTTKYVFHKYNGVEYPAYCLNQTLQGITNTTKYTIDGEISDIMIWRIIINGYPYKTISELGCSNIKEAYSATQHAIYAYQNNNLAGNDFAPIGEEGKRVVNAIKSILEKAKASKSVPSENNKIYYGKAPNSNLQNYAITGIPEEKEEEPKETQKEETPKKETPTPIVQETKKLPKTGM